MIPRINKKSNKKLDFVIYNTVLLAENKIILIQSEIIKGIFTTESFNSNILTPIIPRYYLLSERF